MNKFTELIETNQYNDELLDLLIASLSTMKTTDVITVTLRYKDVTRIIKDFIVENINTDLCTESILLGIEQRRSEKSE